MNNCFWFKHDRNLVDDPRLSVAIDLHGCDAYAAYCIVLEKLISTETGEMEYKFLLSISRKYAVKLEALEYIIKESGLLSFDESTLIVSSAEIKETIENEKVKSQKQKDKIAKRWQEKKEVSNTTVIPRYENEDTTVLPRYNHGNTEQSKAEQSKEEQNRTDTSYDVITRESDFEKVEILETKPTNLKAVPSTTTFPPTPLPKQVNADNYNTWLKDVIYYESLKRNVKSETGVLLDDEQIETAIERFIDYCQSTEEVHQTRKDCRRHFGNWLPKKVKELTLKKLTTGEHNLSASQVRLDFSHLRGK